MAPQLVAHAACCHAGPSFPAFPYTPYPIQQEFMQNLYEALEQGQVGLFESPTGENLFR
jgi:superfamily II DNA or RNA helicase